jgi:hypothetical protein
MTISQEVTEADQRCQKVEQKNSISATRESGYPVSGNIKACWAWK